MNSQNNFMTMIGVEKTLIICGRIPVRSYDHLSEEVTIFILTDHVLRRYDAREQEQLQFMLEDTGCTQLIFVGLLDEEMTGRLTCQSAFHTLRDGLCFRSTLLPKAGKGIDAHFRYQALLDQHVATQCSYLMEYHFVANRVQQRKLTVRGMVGDPSDESFRMVFANGVRFNDVVSMN